MSRGGRVADGLSRGPGAVQATVDFRPFEQRALADQLLESLGGHKRIVDAVHLTRTGRSGGDGDGKVQIGNAFAQAADDGGLPDGRGTGQHHDASFRRLVALSGPSAGAHLLA